MGYTFNGYRRPDGQVGIRNYVGIIPSVTCASDVASAICRQVQGCVTFPHHQGCCQMPPDLERVTDTLISLGKSPNLGAVLIVSLGCEGTDVERLYKEVSATGKHVEIIRIQELGGVSNAIQKGTDIARNMAIEIGGEHLLARRAVGGENGPVGRKIYQIVNEMEGRAKAIGCDMRKGQPTPGNIAGGLSSIEEKSLGAIMKSGSRPIQGVLEYPQHAAGCKGLWIKDTPGREPEILTGMAATGAQFMMFSTGRGAPQGFPCMPVIKICGNPNTYERMKNDMDLNAGVIIEGKNSINEVGEAAFEKMLRVLNGEMTRNEAIQYFTSIDIHCLGPVI